MKAIISKLLIFLVFFNLISIMHLPAFAQNSSWSGQAIGTFLYNEIDTPSVLKDEKYTNSITREEFAELIVALFAKSNNMNKNSIEIKENPFKDTTSLDVQRAYSLGIIQGLGNNTFKPKDNITREQIATMITRFLNIKGINTNTTNNLSDFADKKNISSWAFNSLAYCVENKIITGFQNKLMPKDTATVEQVITILYRISNKNNWIIKSPNMYVNGFFIPSDTQLTSKSYANNVLVLNITWSNITDIDNLKQDLNYILSTRFKNNNDKIKDIIETVITSKEEDEEFIKKININEYQIKITGQKNETFIDLGI